APALGVVGMLVRNQVATGNEYNSLFQRINWFSDSLTIWRSNVLFGAGLRWWYTDRFSVRFQPPNAELEVLSSAGLVGLLGFVVLMGGTVWVLWRVDATYGVLASTVVISRLVQGQLDLFWVSAQVSIPFLIAGICLGAKALADDEQGTRLASATGAAERPGHTVEVS
ncbi:MAG: hypothetical protein ABIO66_18695, partial [Nocardioidaceae bacterium]